MSERTDIAMNETTYSATELDIRYLFGDDLPLNSKDERKNRTTNDGKINILSKEEFTTTGTDLQPETSEILILVDSNLNSTLQSLNIITTNLTIHRQKLQKAKTQANKNSNTGSHILIINNLDLSSHNSTNDSFSPKRKLKSIFTSLEFINEASEKENQL